MKNQTLDDLSKEELENKLEHMQNQLTQKMQGEKAWAASSENNSKTPTAIALAEET